MIRTRMRTGYAIALTFAIAIDSGRARAQNDASAATSARAESSWHRQMPARWICRPDAKGSWREGTEACDRRNGNECRAHCDPIRYCEPKSVSKRLADCVNESNKASCTPLVLHRWLDKLGCTFDPDSFWVPAHARPQKLSDAAEEAALKRPPGNVRLLWDTDGCTMKERPAILDELNNLPIRNTPEGRHAAYGTLLRRGCNPRLDPLGENGPYDHVQLTWNDIQTADSSGVAPTPVVFAWFYRRASVPVGDVPPSNDLVPACIALQRLHDLKHFALCEPPDSDDAVKIRFAGKMDGMLPPTELVQLEAPKCADCPAPPVAGPPPEPTTPPPQPASPIPGALGSAGAGAALAAASRWAFVRIKRKSAKDDNFVAAETHESYGVHVSVGFREPPMIRVFRRDDCPPSAPPSADQRES